MLMDLNIKHITSEDIVILGHQFHYDGPYLHGKYRRAIITIDERQIPVLTHLYKNKMMSHIVKVYNQEDAAFLHDTINKELWNDKHSEYYVHKSVAHDKAFFLTCAQIIIFLFGTYTVFKTFPIFLLPNICIFVLAACIAVVLGTFYEKIYSKPYTQYLIETAEEEEMFKDDFL